VSTATREATGISEELLLAESRRIDEEALAQAIERRRRGDEWLAALWAAKRERERTETVVETRGGQEIVRRSDGVVYARLREYDDDYAMGRRR
jgi:hypothetical protein